MSDEKRKSVCTIDHANKHKEILEARPYTWWLKNAEQLKAARRDRRSGSFRRDRPDRRKA
jgi:hypothetical protein